MISKNTPPGTKVVFVKHLGNMSDLGLQVGDVCTIKEIFAGVYSSKNGYGVYIEERHAEGQAFDLEQFIYAILPRSLTDLLKNVPEHV